jgi:hypothetical protein
MTGRAWFKQKYVDPMITVLGSESPNFRPAIGKGAVQAWSSLMLSRKCCVLVHFERMSLQKLSAKSSSRRLGFYNLETKLRGLLLEVFKLLKTVAFLVILHPFVDVLLTVLQHPVH